MLFAGFLFVGNSCSPVRDFDAAGSKLEVPQEEVGLSAEGFEGVQESSLQLCGEVLEFGRARVGQVVVPGYVGDPEMALKCVLNCKIRVRISSRNGAGCQIVKSPSNSVNNLKRHLLSSKKQVDKNSFSPQ